MMFHHLKLKFDMLYFHHFYLIFHKYNDKYDEYKEKFESLWNDSKSIDICIDGGNDEFEKELNAKKRFFSYDETRKAYKIKITNDEVRETLAEFKKSIKDFEVIKGTMDDVFLNIIHISKNIFIFLDHRIHLHFYKIYKCQLFNILTQHKVTSTQFTAHKSQLSVHYSHSRFPQYL